MYRKAEAYNPLCPPKLTLQSADLHVITRSSIFGTEWSCYEACLADVTGLDCMVCLFLWGIVCVMVFCLFYLFSNGRLAAEETLLNLGVFFMHWIGTCFRCCAKHRCTKSSDL